MTRCVMASTNSRMCNIINICIFCKHDIYIYIAIILRTVSDQHIYLFIIFIIIQYIVEKPFTVEGLKALGIYFTILISVLCIQYIYKYTYTYIPYTVIKGKC